MCIYDNYILTPESFNSCSRKPLPCTWAVKCSFSKVSNMINECIKNFLLQQNPQVYPLCKHFSNFCWFSSVFVFLQNTADKIAFRAAGGLTALENVLQMVTSPTNLNAAARVPFKWVWWVLHLHLESLEYSFHICCFTASSSPSPGWDFRAKNCVVLYVMEGERHFHSAPDFLTWWFWFELWYIWAAANCVKREKTKLCFNRGGDLYLLKLVCRDL